MIVGVVTDADTKQTNAITLTVLLLQSLKDFEGSHVRYTLKIEKREEKRVCKCVDLRPKTSFLTRDAFSFL